MSVLAQTTGSGWVEYDAPLYITCSHDVIIRGLESSPYYQGAMHIPMNEFKSQLKSSEIGRADARM